MNRRRTAKHQRGVTFVFLTLSIVALCGVAALAVDEGLMWTARNKAQVVADAMALAIERDLTASTDASVISAAQSSAATDADNIAKAYSSNGNIQVVRNTTDSHYEVITFPSTYSPDCGSGDTCTAQTLTNNGQIATVSVTVKAPAAFGAVFGRSSVNVKAHATVITAPVGGYRNAVPWAPVASESNPNTGDSSLDADLLWLYDIAHGITPVDGKPTTPDVYQTKEIILKATDMSGSTVQSPGNFGAVDLIGASGGNDYRTNIGYNSSQDIEIGDTITLLTGNKVGPTQQGIDDRLSTNTTPSNGMNHNFTNYDDWFYGRSTYPAKLDKNGNPMVDATTGHTIYNDPYIQDPHDARIAVLPLIRAPWKTGSASVTVIGFAVFFIEQKATGNSQNVVVGRFVGMSLDGTAASTSQQQTSDFGGNASYTSKLVN